MVIPVILNNEKTIFDAEPSTPLLEVLRKYNIFSAKEGCQKGKCGFCAVLVDGKAVPSCSLPVGILRDSEIITLEYFVKTEDYLDIQKGFEQAGVCMCGYCNSARVFSVHNLITDFYKTDKEQHEQILKLADSIKCDCTEKKIFINGIMYAISLRHKRLAVTTTSKRHI